MMTHLLNIFVVWGISSQNSSYFSSQNSSQILSIELGPRALESEDGEAYRELLESLYASLLRNSSSVVHSKGKGGRIPADSFLSQNTVTEG